MKNKLGSVNDGNAPASPLRRKTIKTLAYGVGALAGTTVLPDKWVTPIIQGIALPAHAQTSAPGVTFCSGRHELTLVDGHSGTDEITIEATGCITPAQGNVDLEMTLEGYDTPAITRNEPEGGGGENSFLAAVSDALVPQAHAAPAPKCTVKVKVKTDANGQYKVQFKLNCGKGIVQAVMHGAISGEITSNIGWLDIPGCNPCASSVRIVLEDVDVQTDHGSSNWATYCGTDYGQGASFMINPSDGCNLVVQYQDPGPLNVDAKFYDVDGNELTSLRMSYGDDPHTFTPQDIQAWVDAGVAQISFW